MASAVLVKGSRGTRGLSSERAQCQAGCHNPTTPLLQRRRDWVGPCSPDPCQVLCQQVTTCLKPWGYNGLETCPHQLSPPG